MCRRIQIAAVTLSGNLFTLCSPSSEIGCSPLKGCEGNCRAESIWQRTAGLWLTSPAGWLPRTGISSGTQRSVIEYGLPLLFLAAQRMCVHQWSLVNYCWQQLPVLLYVLSPGVQLSFAVNIVLRPPGKQLLAGIQPILRSKHVTDRYSFSSAFLS